MVMSAVVMGAAMGIGKEIARRLVAAGMRVVAVNRDEATLTATAAEFGEAIEPLVGDW